jgi:hypothetical protein
VSKKSCLPSDAFSSVNGLSSGNGIKAGRWYWAFTASKLTATFCSTVVRRVSPMTTDPTLGFVDIIIPAMIAVRKSVTETVRLSGDAHIMLNPSTICCKQEMPRRDRVSPTPKQRNLSL